MADEKISQLTDGTPLQATDKIPVARGAANFYVNIDLSTKADLNSPAFTGEPTAPTQDPNTSSNALATCAYVDSLIDNLPLGVFGEMTETDLLVVDISGQPKLFQPNQIEATPTVSGFMSSADKIKLNNSDTQSIINALIFG